MLNLLPQPKLGICALLAVAVMAFGQTTPAKAEDARSRAISDLLQQERRQLIALGANRAKKLAGINRKLSTRIATMASPREAEPQGSMIASFSELKALPKAAGGPEWACLTEALYFEARGESFEGIAAVGEVILNRAKSSRFPNSICGVINQGVGGRPGCQFSYKCDGHAEVFREKAAYARVGKMAKLLLEGRLEQVSNGALFYHTKHVRPRWSRKFRRVAQVGVHLFYHPG